MADDLANDLEKFRLTEEEEIVIGESDESNIDDNTKSKIALMMMGKLLTDRPFNFEAMKRTLRSVWRLKDEVAVRMVKSNLFMFQFLSMVDKNRVVAGCPWFFDNQLLLLKEISGDDQISEVYFKSTPCWIRIYDVPFAKRNSRMAEEIGKCMGGLLEYDASDPLGLEQFMRMKIHLDIEKPLRRGLKIATSKGSSKWVDIKYERIGDFCYYCGRLGHIDRDCLTNNGEEDKPENMVYKYGPWLRASPIKRYRSSHSESDKERKLLDKLKNSREERCLSYDDPGILKLGPPSMARKSLAQEFKEVECGVENREESPLIIADPGNNSPSKESGEQETNEFKAQKERDEYKSGGLNEENGESEEDGRRSIRNKATKWKRIPRAASQQESPNENSTEVLWRKRDIGKMADSPMDIDEGDEWDSGGKTLMWRLCPTQKITLQQTF
ncbi:hypothetical protein RDABS01_030128 [Bienertia sinuspersici]